MQSSLRDDDVLALAVVEERGELLEELDRIGRDEGFPLDGVGQGGLSRVADEGDVVRMEAELRIAEQTEEEIGLLRPGRADQGQALPSEVEGHAPDGVDAEQALGDVGDEAEGEAPERAVAVGVDEDARLRRRVVERPRLAAGDAVHGVDDAVRLEVGVELGRATSSPSRNRRGGRRSSSAGRRRR